MDIIDYKIDKSNRKDDQVTIQLKIGDLITIIKSVCTIREEYPGLNTNALDATFAEIEQLESQLCTLFIRLSEFD